MREANLSRLLLPPHYYQGIYIQIPVLDGILIIRGAVFDAIDLNGGINQILRQKHSLIADFKSISYESEKEFGSVDPYNHWIKRKQ